MDIAIKFERFNLDETKCIFKPITIIRGEYDNKNNTFISEAGDWSALIHGASIYDDSFFGHPTTLEELRKTYGSGTSDEALLSNYFSLALDSCYIGIYDEEEEINVLQLPIAGYFDQLFSNEENSETTQTIFTFDIDYIKKIRNSSSLEEVQKELDNLINISKNSLNDLDEAFGEVGSEAHKKSAKSQLKLKKEESKKFNLAKLRKEVKSKIIAQDNAVNKVTTAIAVNYTSKNPKHKSHILIAGPSGTGKTEMVNIIADYLDVPYFKADATAYTKEGYVGKSVQSMLSGLLDAADGDIEKAQNGILIIDEIDKKSGGDRSDVSSQAVLSSLLKIMDRGIIEVNTNYYSTFDFDTSNLTIIFMGAFAEVYKKKGKEKKQSIGFSSQGENIQQSNKNITITKQDLIEDGMTPEFMGRIDEIIPTDEFTLEGLLEILYKSKISPIKREREYFKDMNVSTVFTKSFYTQVAKNCLESGTGARDLKRCVHESLTEAYDEVLLGKRKIKKLRFTKDTVNDPKKYYVS